LFSVKALLRPPSLPPPHGGSFDFRHHEWGNYFKS